MAYSITLDALLDASMYFFKEIVKIRNISLNKLRIIMFQLSYLLGIR